MHQKIITITLLIFLLAPTNIANNLPPNKPGIKGMEIVKLGTSRNHSTSVDDPKNQFLYLTRKCFFIFHFVFLAIVNWKIYAYWSLAFLEMMEEILRNQANERLRYKTMHRWQHAENVQNVDEIEQLSSQLPKKTLEDLLNFDE